MLWVTNVDSTSQSMVTTSPVVAKGMAIVGVASNEELTAAFVSPMYWQFQFRGSAVALDVSTGAIKWQTFTVPNGYYGGSIWGSTPSVDLLRNQVYVTTGDNYMAPKPVLNCLLGGGAPSTCVDPADYADSVIALDLNTGDLKWGVKGRPDDIWNVACGLGVPGFTIGYNPAAFPGVWGNCPDPTGNQNPLVQGPDYDFGQGPMMFSDTGSYTDRGLVGAGGKSGIFWAINAQTGKTVWSEQVSPGGVTGGMQWGSATDGATIYVTASNAGPSLMGAGQAPAPWTLKNGTVTEAGGWAAVDAATGAVKWTTPDPSFNGSTPNTSRAEGPATLANGVLFGCNMQGTMFAFSAKTGAPLWQHPLATRNPCISGAAVVNGMVFWGSGGGRNNPLGAKTVFAFGL